MNQADLQATENLYHQLLKGLDHELVNEDNVDQLIARAEADGHPVLAAELREWRAGCGRDRPSSVAPAPGFNREHKQR
jgi:hypothetical protein